MPNKTDHSDEQELSRAENYDVLGLLLSAAPSAEVLEKIAAISGDATPMGQAWAELARAAAENSADRIEREFFELFIGVGRGELLPYASFYITGFLNERPLAELRGDLARLRIQRQHGDHEPEDRIALICGVMAAYARKEFDGLADAPSEAEFFARHLAPWGGVFFEDLATAPAARFYAALAKVGARFIAIEQQAFALDATGSAVA